MAEDKNRKIIQKIVIGCIIVLGIIAFRYFDLGQYFTLEYIKASQDKFQALYLDSRLLVADQSLVLFLVPNAGGHDYQTGHCTDN